MQEQVLDTLPLVSEMNAISEELNKYQKFDVVLMTVAGHDGTTTKGTKLVGHRVSLLLVSSPFNLLQYGLLG